MYMFLLIIEKEKEKIIYFDFVYFRDGLIIIGDIEMVF